MTSSFSAVVRPLSRRQLLRGSAAGAALFAAGGALAACGSSDPDTPSGSAALPTVNFQLVWIKNVQFGGSYVADTSGYYKSEGVAVSILAGGPAVAVTSTIVTGKADIGIDGPDAVANAVAEGAPLKLIAAGYQKSPNCVMSPIAKAITTPDEMRGKTIGVPADSRITFDTFLKANKIPTDVVSVVPVQYDPTVLTTGQMDGYFGFLTNEPTILKLKGFETHVLSFDDFGLPMLAETYAATSDTLADKDKRAALVKFLRGEIRGWQDVVADPAPAAKLAVDVYGKDQSLDLNEQTIEAGVQNTLVNTDETKKNGLLTMSDERIEETLASLAVGGIKADKSLFDTSVLEEVYAGKTKL